MSGAHSLFLAGLRTVLSAAGPPRQGLGPGPQEDHPPTPALTCRERACGDPGRQRLVDALPSARAQGARRHDERGCLSVRMTHRLPAAVEDGGADPGDGRRGAGDSPSSCPRRPRRIARRLLQERVGGVPRGSCGAHTTGPPGSPAGRRADFGHWSSAQTVIAERSSGCRPAAWAKGAAGPAVPGVDQLMSRGDTVRTHTVPAMIGTSVDGGAEAAAQVFSTVSRGRWLPRSTPADRRRRATSRRFRPAWARSRSSDRMPRD
jgi:hypothetical protein